MATRFYLASSGNVPLPGLDIAGSWGASNVVRLPMSTVRSRTALTTRTMAWASTASLNWCWWQFQSPPIASPLLLDGTNQLIIGKCGETSANGNTSLVYTARLVSATGMAKATLREVVTAGAEFPLIASAATRSRGALGTLAIEAALGDVIVLEVGVRGVAPAVENIQMRVGDPEGVADFAFSEGLATDLVSWFEMSAEIPFLETYFDYHFVNSIAGGSSLVLRPAQSSADVALTVAAGHMVPIKSKQRGSTAVAVGMKF